MKPFAEFNFPVRRVGAAGLFTALAVLWGAITPAAEGQGGSGEAANDVVRIFETGDDAAAAGALKSKADSGGKPSALTMLARTGFWLGLVVLMLCGLMVMARRFLPKSVGMFKSPTMELMGRSYLDPKRCVYLLKVGGRMLVVGSAENGLSSLGEISDPEEVEYLTALARNGSGQPGESGRGFAAALGRRVSGLAGLLGGGGDQVENDCEGLDLPASGREYEFAGGDAVAEAGGEFDALREKVEGLKARLQTIS